MTTQMEGSDTDWEENCQQVDQKPPKITLFNFFKKVAKEKKVKCQETGRENDQDHKPGEANAIEVADKRKHLSKNQQSTTEPNHLVERDWPTSGMHKCLEELDNCATFALAGGSPTSDKESACSITDTKHTSQAVGNEVQQSGDEFNLCPETQILAKSCKKDKKGKAKRVLSINSVDRVVNKEVMIENPDSQTVLSRYNDKDLDFKISHLVSINETVIITSNDVETKISEEECVTSKTICESSKEQNAKVGLKLPAEIIVAEPDSLSTNMKIHYPEEKVCKVVPKRNENTLCQEKEIEGDRACAHLPTSVSSGECGASENKEDLEVTFSQLKTVEDFEEHNLIIQNSKDSKKFLSLFMREAVLKQELVVLSDEPTPIPTHSHIMQLTAAETDWLSRLKRPSNIRMQPYHALCTSSHLTSRIKEFGEFLDSCYLSPSNSQIVLLTGYTTIENASQEDESLLSLVERYKESSKKVIQDCLDRYIKAQKVIQATWREHMASSVVTVVRSDSKEGTRKPLLAARKHSAIKEALKVAVKKKRGRPPKAPRTPKRDSIDDDIKLIEMKPAQVHVVKKGGKRLNQPKRKNELAKYFNARIKQVRTGKIGNVSLKQSGRLRTRTKEIVQEDTVEEENSPENAEKARIDFFNTAKRLRRSTLETPKLESSPIVKMEEEDDKMTQNLKTRKVRRNRRVLIDDDTNVETGSLIQRSRGTDIRSLFNPRLGGGAHKSEEDDTLVESPASKRTSRRKRESVRCSESHSSDAFAAKRMKCELKGSDVINENYNDAEKKTTSKGRRKKGQKEQSSQDPKCAATEASGKKDESRGRDIRVMFSAVFPTAVNEDCNSVEEEELQKTSFSQCGQPFPVALGPTGDLGNHNGKKMAVQKILPKSEEAHQGSILQTREIPQATQAGNEISTPATLNTQEMHDKDSVQSTALQEILNDDGNKSTDGLNLYTCRSLSSSNQVQECSISAVTNGPQLDEGSVDSCPGFAQNDKKEKRRKRKDVNKLESYDQVLNSFTVLESDDLRLDRKKDEDVLSVLISPLRRSSRLRNKEIVELKSSIEERNVPESLNAQKKGIKKRRQDKKEVLGETNEPSISQRSSQDSTEDRTVLENDKLEPTPNTLTVEAPPLNAETVNYSMTWTEKYTPLSSSMVLDFCSSGTFLFQWLKEWKDRHERYVSKLNQYKTRKAKKSFMDSDTESSDDDDEDMVNTAVLAGPVGNGSTASVYACAYELGYKVLELNPSSCRSGKIVMSQFGEATQSHQVRRQGDGRLKPSWETQQVPVATKDFFNKRSQEESKEATAIGESGKTSKAMSVILFEQADVVFEEQDKGFWQAVTELRNEAKRPIIFTVNDATVLKSFQGREPLILRPERPPLQALCSNLQAICLSEKVYIDPVSLRGLIMRCNRDFRKALLQLEFWVEQWKFNSDGAVLNAGCENSTNQDGNEVLPNCSDVNFGNNTDEIEAAIQVENTEQIEEQSPKSLGSLKGDEIPTTESLNDKMAKESRDDKDPEAERVSCFTLNFPDERLDSDFMARDKIDMKALTKFLDSRNPEYYTLLETRSNSGIKDEQLSLISSLSDARSAVDKAVAATQQKECFGWWQSEILPVNVDELPTTEPQTACSELDSVLLHTQRVLDYGLRMVYEEQQRSPSLPPGEDRRWQHLLQIQERLPFQRSISHREFVLDCMPALSIMSHSEQVRKATQVKRSRRFLHYFDSIALHLDDDVKALLANQELP